MQKRLRLISPFLFATILIACGGSQSEQTVGPAQPEVQPSALSPEQIEEVVSQRNEAYQSCYQRGLQRLSRLSGQLVYRLTIAPTGRVQRAEVSRGELRSERVQRCLSVHLRALTFPANARGQWTWIEYPFEFSGPRRMPGGD